MGLFKTTKTTSSVISPVKKSFADQLADVKSVFKKAYDEALNVSEQCTNHITKKQVEIKEIETEIKANCNNSSRTRKRSISSCSRES